MHMAMVCSDDPVHALSELKTAGVGSYARLFGEAAAEEYLQICSFIGVKELPDSTDINVSADIPTLLLTGSLDVATPVFRSEAIARDLPNATLVVFPGRTHVQIAGANRCAADIMVQFVQDPNSELDQSCLNEGEMIGFVLPDGSSSRE